jgi:hypothetical protein
MSLLPENGQFKGGLDMEKKKIAIIDEDKSGGGISKRVMEMVVATIALIILYEC